MWRKKSYRYIENVRQVNVLKQKKSYNKKVKVIKLVLDTSYQMLANFPVIMSEVIGYFTQKQFEGALDSASGNMVQQPN